MTLISQYESLISDIEVIIQSDELNHSFSECVVYERIQQFRAEREREKLLIPEFIKLVCMLSGCNADELSSRNRKRELVRARQLILVAGVNHFNLTLEKAGDLVGRDHATFYNSYSAVLADYQTNSVYRDTFAYIFLNYPNVLIKRPM